MEGKLVKTITPDGLELTGFWMKSKSDIALLHVHGTAGDFYTHKFIEQESLALKKNKISFLTVNTRGHDVYADLRKYSGNKVEWKSIGGGFEIFEDCVLDIQAWVDFLKRQGVRKIILQGHSLGAQKVLYYQYKAKSPLVLGEIHLSPQNDAGYVRVKFGEKKYMEINDMINHLIKQNKSAELLPKEFWEVCPMSAQTYAGYLIEEGKGTLHPFHNPRSKNWKALQNMKESLLVVLGENDTYINESCKSKGIDEIVQILKSKKLEGLTVKIIAHANHSYMGTEAELIRVIISWLQKNIKK